MNKIALLESADLITIASALVKQYDGLSQDDAVVLYVDGEFSFMKKNVKEFLAFTFELYYLFDKNNGNLYLSQIPMHGAENDNSIHVSFERDIEIDDLKIVEEKLLPEIKKELINLGFSKFGMNGLSISFEKDRSSDVYLFTLHGVQFLHSEIQKAYKWYLDSVGDM